MLEFIGGFVLFGVAFLAGVWGVGLTCFAIMEWRARNRARTNTEAE